MRIPFGTVKITEQSKKLVLECLECDRISGGRLVRQFESRFADLNGAKEAVALSSGTDALTLSLSVLYDLGADRGDEIILPALSFVATGSSVLHAGFKPVFVDVDRNTLNIDVKKIEKSIGKKTRAIMPVHLMGKPADMDIITDLARGNNLIVIEDAAQAFGAVYKGKRIGTLGDMAAFSLYVAHVITTGEGGIVLTNNERYSEILRSLRAHGRACKCKECISNISSGFCEKRFARNDIGDIRFHIERLGYSSKMNELEAALGLGNLDNYDDIITKRRYNLMAMITLLEEFSNFFWTFQEENGETIGPHAIPIVVKENSRFSRNEFLYYLEQKGIDARTLFSSIPTQCSGFEFLGYQNGDFPNAEYIGKNGIHIGVHQDIEDADIDWLGECLNEFVNSL